jgi:hypothetical protein
MASTATTTVVSTPAPVKVVGAPKTTLRGWGLDYGRLLADDYLQKKFLTVKYTGKGSTFNFNGKEVFEFNKEDKFANTSNEAKLITNCHGKNWETKFDSKGLVRVWTNWGEHKIGKPVTLITKLKTNSTFSRFSGSLAAEFQASKCALTARVDVKQNYTPYLSEKIVFTDGKFKLGLFTKLNLSVFGLRRYNAFAQWSTKDLDLFLEHVSPNPNAVTATSNGADVKGLSLGKILLASVFRWKDTQFIARASYRSHKPDDRLRLVFGHITKVNDKLEVRGKADSHGKATFAGRYKCNSNFSFVASTQVNLKEPKKFLTGKTLPIPLGLGVEFSYN